MLSANSVTERCIHKVLHPFLSMSAAFGSPCCTTFFQTTTTTHHISLAERSQTMPTTSIYQHPVHVFGGSDEQTPPTSKIAGSSSSVPTSVSVEFERRQCSRFQIDYCKQLPYNTTTFPNGMGHKSTEDAKYDIDRFR